MSLLSILNLLREYKDVAIILVVVFLSLVEITPTKVNPWTCLIKWVSHVQGLDKLNEEVGNIRLHMDEIDTKIDNLKTESEEKSALKDALLAEFTGAEIYIEPTYGLCSFYAEQGGLIIGFEI